MVRGAVALPSAGSPGASARRTTSGGRSSPAAAARPPSTTAAKARAPAQAIATAIAVVAGALVPLFALLLIALLIPPFLALHGALRMPGLAHRLCGRHALDAEGARARRAGDLRAPLVARRVQRRLGTGILMVLQLHRHRPEARLIPVGRLDRGRLRSRAGTADEADPRVVDGDVVHHVLVVDVVHGGDVHVGDRGVVPETVVLPPAAAIAVAVIAVAIVDAAVVADVRSPVPRVKDVHRA